MFNYGFELFVNLFQGVMFTVFCYKFLTPSRNKICEGIAFCVASLLMFLSITQINRLYVSFAYIETVVFFAIMIPYCVLFFKDRIFVKILTPVILNVIYSVLSFGINYIFSAIISCDYNYLMIESSQYRYMYVLMSNLIFVIVLFIIYNLFKNSLSHIHKQEILITLVIPLLSIAVGLLTFLVSSNADISDFDRIVLGAVSIIILSFTFINFYLIKSLSKNYSLENENILLNKEKELYNVQMTSSEKYMKNLTYVKHNIQNQLLCIENLIDGQRYDEAKKMCNNVNNNISANVHFCKTGYVYLDAIFRPCGNDAFSLEMLNSYLYGFDPRPHHNYYVKAYDIGGVYDASIYMYGDFCASFTYILDRFVNLAVRKNEKVEYDTFYENGKKTYAIHFHGNDNYFLIFKSCVSMSLYALLRGKYSSYYYGNHVSYIYFCLNRSLTDPIPNLVFLSIKGLFDGNVNYLYGDD